MNEWNKPLTRENFDRFYRIYAPFAFKSAYKVVGDTTRTELVLIESFVGLYQKRKEIPVDELTDFFGTLLKEKIDKQTEAYPVRETEQGSTRSLDEFTMNSMLEEIHKQIDSVMFRMAEMVVGGLSSSDSNRDSSFIRLFRSTGLSLLALIQFALLAIIIYLITTVSSMSMISKYEGIPRSPDEKSISVSDVFMEAKTYFPLRSINE